MLVHIQKILDAWTSFSSVWKDVKRDAGPESVHDIRVASRRLSASLFLIHVAAVDDKVLDAKRGIGKVRRRLGPLRDVQVQRARVSEEKPAKPLLRFDRALENAERKEIRKAREYLTAARRKKLHRQLERASTLPVPYPLAARQRLDEAIGSARAALREAASRFVPEAPETLHALRIAIKKLRYMGENAEALFGIAVDDLEELKRLQSALGEIRDLQVLEERVRNWAKKQKKSDKVVLDGYSARLARKRVRKLKGLILSRGRSARGIPGV
jgi:CHAD domain-containing protein